MKTSKIGDIFDSHQKLLISEKLVLMSLLFLLLINTVLAVEIKLSKETYSSGETLQAEIYGNFIDGLKLENIYFYQERAIPVVYDVLKTKDKYLLYAILPYREGNYTIKIKNARYTTETGTSTATIEKNFIIEETNETVLTVSPGFVVAREDFFIIAKANKNIGIEAEFEATGEKQEVSLVQGVEKRIHFSTSGISNYTESKIKIQNYNIPVFIFPEKSQEEIIEETGSFRFNPLELKATLLLKQDFSFKVSLLNLGNINLENIKLSSDAGDDLKVKIEPDSITLLEAGGEKLIDIIFSSKKEGIFTGKIFADSGNLTADLDIEIEITKNESEIKYETPTYTQETNCNEIGKICGADEVCDGVTQPSQQGSCCVGTCKKEKQEESYNWIWGLIIIISVIGALALLFYFMKKKQKKPENVLERRRKSFEERMKIPSGTEMRGSLSKE